VYAVLFLIRFGSDLDCIVGASEYAVEVGTDNWLATWEGESYLRSDESESKAAGGVRPAEPRRLASGRNVESPVQDVQMEEAASNLGQDNGAEDEAEGPLVLPGPVTELRRSPEFVRETDKWAAHVHTVGHEQDP